MLASVASPGGASHGALGQPYAENFVIYCDGNEISQNIPNVLKLYRFLLKTATNERQ